MVDETIDEIMKNNNCTKEDAIFLEQYFKRALTANSENIKKLATILHISEEHAKFRIDFQNNGIKPW